MSSAAEMAARPTRKRLHASLVIEQPLYRQVYRAIADEIAAGSLAAGDRLPAERVLCERFKVGRATIRRAIAQLAEEGLVESAVGRGTFVSTGPLSETPFSLMSLTELGAARGLRTTARVLKAQTSPATIDEAESFQIAPGSPLFELERLRFLEEYEFALARSLVPLGLAPLLPSADWTQASLYQVLQDAGASPWRGEYVVWSAAADERTAALLGIAPGDPVLTTSTRAYDIAQRLVEMSTVTYRADRYRMRTVLTRGNKTARASW